VEIAKLVHEAVACCITTAQLNAILGKVRPGDHGFDAIHMNLHKTFSDAARGCGVRARARWVCRTPQSRFLPIPMIEQRADGRYGWCARKIARSRSPVDHVRGKRRAAACLHLRACSARRHAARAEYATLNAN